MLIKMNLDFKICPNCLTENKIDSKSCSTCGFDLEKQDLANFDVDVFYDIDDLIDDAVLMYEGEDYDASLEFIEFYLEFNPNDSMAWTFKAHVLNKLGFIKDSISYCNYALNLDDMCEVSWQSKAYFFNLVSNYDACISCCDAGLTLDPQNEFILKLKEYSLKKLSDGGS